MLENPNIIFPLKGRKVTYIKNTIKNKEKIIVGDYTYYASNNFEKQVTHLYPWYDEKLIIGKFCSIAQGVEILMNGCNHVVNGASSYPFYIFKGWNHKPWPKQKLSCKGNTIIGNDVWIGQNAVILPGVIIGDGAIIGANAVVGKDIPPYCVAVGNPAKVVKKRFSDKVVKHLLTIKWWNWPAIKIKKKLKIITDGSEKEILQLK